MKRNTLETIVLVLGICIIGVALAMMFIFEPSEELAPFTNVIFSVGFLIYIIYSMMATNSQNKEIRGLNNHIKSLKETITEKDTNIAQLESNLSTVKSENQELKANLETSNSTITSLQDKIKELESTEPEASAES